MKKLWPILLYLFLFMLFVLWSYSLTDKNLVISQWQPYLQFQNWMWQVDPQLNAKIYLMLISALLITYTISIRSQVMHVLTTSQNSPLKLFISVSLILLFAYNAFSHDVFNYMFNAKMLLVYQVDPHIHSAIEFPTDTWLRFMHNVHTPAPYFYGWTFLSLIPFLLGLGKFFTTWFAFKIWSSIGWGLLIWIQWRMVKILKLDSKQFWEFGLHPLILIEILAMSHNDAWMMALALLSFYFLIKNRSAMNIKMICISFIFLILSATTKYVTIILFPLWLVLVIEPLILIRKSSISNFCWHSYQFILGHIFDLASILLFLPLLTARSQWFHPWYLVWSLSFLPFVKWKWLRIVLLSLSFSSLFRYYPWIWNGAFEYSSSIISQQYWITWGIGAVFIVCWLSFLLLKKRSHAITR